MSDASQDVTSGHIGDFRPDPENARKHNPRNIGMIERSLQETGAGRSLVSTRDGTIIAGNGVLEAAAAAGITEAIIVPTRGDKLVIVRRDDLETGDTAATKLALYDNQTGTLSTWDDQQLRDLRAREAGIDFRAIFNDDEWKRIAGDDFRAPIVDGDAITVTLPAEPLTKTGDCWRLGPHRLLCGDATNGQHVRELLGDDRVALVVTSPPYGVQKVYEGSSIADSLASWYDLMHRWVAVWSAHAPAALVNLADVRVGPNNREVHTYGEFVTTASSLGWPLIATRMWMKQPAWSAGPYWLNSYRGVDDFEYLGLFGATAHKERVHEDWRYRGTWEMPSVATNDDHPSKFPIELPLRGIRLLTDPGDVVADPFLGSGTTILACEQSGRVGLGMDLSPAYCDLAVRRWETLTGQIATREER